MPLGKGIFTGQLKGAITSAKEASFGIPGYEEEPLGFNLELRVWMMEDWRLLLGRIFRGKNIKKARRRNNDAS